LRGSILTSIPRLRWIVPALIATLLATSLVMVTAAAPAAAVAPGVSVSLTGGQILAGETGTYSISATNSGATDGYNLALYLDVPDGINFVSSTLGTPVIYNSLNQPTTPLAAGMQRWVWEDVSDLPAGGSYGGTVTVLPAQPAMGGGDTLDPAVSPVGSSFTLTAHAALSGDPTYLPVFNGSTGVGGAPAIAETGTSTPAALTADVVSLLIDKSEPSPESELLRGAHDQSTVYTLVVRATTEGETENSVLVDYLPAGLEFMGCGTDDFSTVDRALADIDINEYDGAPALSAIPDVTTDCVIPASVDTIVADASLAADYGLAINSTYTRVTWNLGTLAAGSVTTIRYAASIPLRENTITWDGPQPTGASLEQTSNLDNNNGASTRHGTEADHTDGTVWTNVATVGGDYQGVVRTGAERAVGDIDTESVHAMDLSVLKDVDGADEQFEVGNIADFTLTLRQSEYMHSTAIVLTDVVPNGLCPLLPAGVDFTLDPGATVTPECEADGVVTGAVVVYATAHIDGTFTLVLRPTVGLASPDDFVLDPNTEHQITYEALNRDAYVTADEYGSTTSGDAFGNTVEVEAQTFAIDELAEQHPETYLVWDDSGETLATDLTTINKRVLPRNLVTTGAAPGVDPCPATGYTDAVEGDFRLGDTVCFELRVDFPSSIDARNPVVTDFLPAGLTYVGSEVSAASTVTGAAVATNTSGATAGRIEWQLGTLGAGGDLYVPRGAVFIAHVWATVDQPSNGLVLDKPENLMKYRQENVQGQLYFLRDAAAIEVDPELQLLKGVVSVTANGSVVAEPSRAASSSASGNGNDFLSDRDGIVVREGEVVQYRVDLHGLPYDASAALVWDVLPAGVQASDVSAISHGGVAYDPADAGHPESDLDPTTELASAYDGRSIIVWTDVAVPSGQATLTYNVTVPVGIGAQSALNNIASIISYRAGINTSATPDAQLYVPAGSLNTALALAANTAGIGTSDDSSVNLPAATVAKTQTSPTATNNTADRVVPGELAEFTYSVTIPAYTSVLEADLQDIIQTPGNWQIVATQSWVDHPGGSTAPGSATGFIIGAFDPFAFTPSTGYLDFPDLYTNNTASPQTFTVHLSAYIRPGASWTHNTGASQYRTDTARFDSTTTGQMDAGEGVYLIEPNPTVTKIANDTTVYAGQTVTYTLTASNANGRPTLFDTQVIDCVPGELTSITWVSGSQGSASVVADPSCATGTRIVWQVGSIAGNANATLSYSVVVSSAAAGAAAYTNTARLTGYSLDDPSADRRTYTRNVNETITVEGASITKTTDTTSPTIGEEVAYTVTTTIPANVNFYDATIIDDVPTSMAISNVTVTCTDSALAPCDGDLPGGGAAIVTSGTNHGWWLGDVLSDPLDRVITVTYTGTVLDQVDTNNGDGIVNVVRLRWNIINTLTTAPNGSFTGTASAGPANATVVVQEPDVTVSKLVNGVTSDVVDPGDTFSYELTVANGGTSEAYDVVVTDDIPVGVVVNPATINAGGVLTGAGVNGGGTITWQILMLGAGTDTSLTYSATLTDSTALNDATLTNTVSVDEYFSHPTGAGYDDDERRQYAGDSDTADVTPGFPDPQIAKAVTGGAIAYIGEEKTFTLTITNPGDGPATNLLVEDVLPAGFEYVSGSAVITPGADLDPTVVGQTLTWDTLNDVAVSGSLTIQYRAVPLASHTWDTSNTGSDVAHTNTATVWADDTADFPENAEREFTDDTSALVRIHDADLSVTKSHTGAIVAGQNTTWAITVTNAAGSDAAVGPIVVTDQLPADAEYVSISGAGWTVSSYDSGTNVLTLSHAGPLAANASLTVNVTASFAADVANGTDAENSVCVDARTFDSDTSDNCDDDPGTVTTLADVELEKLLVGTTYTAGEPISWTLDVTNNGPSISHAPFTMVDTLPAGVDLDSVVGSGSGWTCDPVDHLAGQITCTWTGVALTVGDDLPTLTITADVLSSTTGTVMNTATVTPTTPEPTVPGASNNTDTVSVADINTEADLALIKTVASDELVAGGQGRYRITVENLGPSDAVNVIVTDQLPAGLTFAGGLTDDSTHAWSCEASLTVTGQVDCVLDSNLGTLIDEDSTWFEFDVDIASWVTEEVTNTAVTATDTPEVDTDNNDDSVSQDPFVETNISITKTHDDTPVYRAGDEVVFTLTVANDGAADAEDVTITEAIPVGTTYARVENATGWTADGPTAGVVTLTLDSPLEAGDSASIDVVLTLDHDAVPGFINNVVVTTTTDETDPDDNDDSEPVEVDTPDLEIVKTANATLVEGGDTFTYTLSVNNVDDDAHADTVVVTDQIPADLAVLTDPADIGGVDWDCTLTGTSGGFGGTLECTLATLAADTIATALVFDVEVAADVARDTIPNAAEVASDDEHPDYVDGLNQDDVDVDVKWISFTGNSVCVADVPWFQYTIDARNLDQDLPITLTWYPDAAGDGTPDGPAIAVQTLTAQTGSAPITGEILWPGAEVDEHGIGIGWPGGRKVVAGETPDWENYILDPSLPEYALRAGAMVVVEINPEASVHADYPPVTVDCEAVRDPVLDIDKTANGTFFNRSQIVEYTLVATNTAYGATDDVVLRDPVPADLKVESVTPELSTDPTIADWQECSVSGQDAGGYGGTVECVLDGWLGYGQTAPAVMVEASFKPGTGLGSLTNVATVFWTDPDEVDGEQYSADNPATVTVILSAAELLALTGLESFGVLWIAVALLAGGGILILIDRRRRRTA
jgi:uncharacterized repeat protein (TIGR01451 family)/fimbrial isopeptide formation D2 family protein